MIGVTSSRRIGKMEKPRPLKIMNMVDQSLESVLSDMDQVSHRLSSTSMVVDSSLLSLVASLCENLRMFGPQLETLYKDQLDRCFISLRNGCRDDRLSLASRYRLLEVIELRAMQWMPNENLTNYYKQKLIQIEAEESAIEKQQQQQQHQHQSQPEVSPYISQQTMISPTGTTITSPIFPQPGLNQYPTPPYSTPQTPIIYSGQHQMLHQQQTLPLNVQLQSPLPSTGQLPPSLSPGEVIKTSGKFLKPTRIAGKNYCKDEVVIRNADSGKVMGMKGRRVHMIEELSETIISFQRVAPGARERLVQITGPNEDNISHAIQLIEETIRRNASPLRSDDDQRGIYASTTHGGSTSSISSHTSDDLVQNSKRSNLLNSPHQHDEDLPTEYKYTVAHGGDSIRITGSNLDLVRTAKLILDEHLNGERNLNNGFIPFEFQPKDVPKDITPMKIGDSPATSPSPPASLSSHKKSSPPPVKLNSATVQLQPVTTTPQEAPPEMVKGTVTILRQPLIPSSTKETIESVENVSQVSKKESKNRRALFAKTSDERSTDDTVTPTPISTSAASGIPLTSQRISHTRDFLIRCAESPHARCTPQDWAHVVRKCAPAVKKGWLHIPSLLQIMNEKGDNTINVIPTYLQKNELIDPSEIENAPNRWSLLRSTSTNADDEDNGNSTMT